MSVLGAKVGLCLPRSTEATSVASRPRTRPSASTMRQVRVMSAGLGENVRTRIPCSVMPGVQAPHGADLVGEGDTGRLRMEFPPAVRPPWARPGDGPRYDQFAPSGKPVTGGSGPR